MRCGGRRDPAPDFDWPRRRLTEGGIVSEHGLLKTGSRREFRLPVPISASTFCGLGGRPHPLWDTCVVGVKKPERCPIRVFNADPKVVRVLRRASEITVTVPLSGFVRKGGSANCRRLLDADSE